MTARDWQSYSLWPDDVLFFRDGKPSTVGEDHYLRSLFPPHPTTLYGAVRTRRLFDEGIELQGLHRSSWKERLGDLTEELGEWGRFGTLELRGPWLVRRKDGGELETLLPAPQDLGLVTHRRLAGGRQEVPLEDRTPSIERVIRYQCRPRRSLDPSPQQGWSHDLGIWLPSEEDEAPSAVDVEPAAGWYLTPQGIASWADGKTPQSEEFVHQSHLWVDEPRTGVGLQSGPKANLATEQRKHADGQLFTFGFIRLRPGIGLGFEARGTLLSACGALRLGGDGRTATLEPGPSLPSAASPGPSPGKPYCLAFATPTLSHSGALPPGSANGSSFVLGEVPHRVIGAILKQPQLIGGWDLARNRAKPLRRAIPAGSTYLVVPADSSLQTAVQLHGCNLCDDFSTPRNPAQELARQGFGLALTGKYPWEDEIRGY